MKTKILILAVVGVLLVGINAWAEPEGDPLQVDCVVDFSDPGIEISKASIESFYVLDDDGEMIHKQKIDPETFKGKVFSPFALGIKLASAATKTGAKAKLVEDCFEAGVNRTLRAPGDATKFILNYAQRFKQNVAVCKKYVQANVVCETQAQTNK